MSPFRVGSRCWTMTNAMPHFGGTCFRNCSNASSPPADAPMPTIGNATLGFGAGVSSVTTGTAFFGRRAGDVFFSINFFPATNNGRGFTAKSHFLPCPKRVRDRKNDHNRKFSSGSPVDAHPERNDARCQRCGSRTSPHRKPANFRYKEACLRLNAGDAYPHKSKRLNRGIQPRCDSRHSWPLRDCHSFLSSKTRHITPRPR